MFASQKVAGVGVLVRDVDGNTIGELSKKIWAPLRAIKVEAKAVETGLQFAKDLLIQDFILEGDSLIMTNALKELSPPPSSVAAIVYNSLSATREFQQVEFSHVCRQGTKPAHLLAKYAQSIDDFSVWIEDDPCFIVQALLQDVNCISLVQKKSIVFPIKKNIYIYIVYNNNYFNKKLSINLESDRPPKKTKLFNFS